MKELLGKRAITVLPKLKEKKVIYEKQVLKDLPNIFFKLKMYVHSQITSNSISGCIDSNECDLSDAKVNLIMFDNSERNELKIVFENHSYRSIPNKAFTFKYDAFYSHIQEQPKEFYTILRQFHSFSREWFYDTIEELNPFFFNYGTIGEYPMYDENDIKPLFLSRVEYNKYHFLSNKYRIYIIMVNVRLADLIVVKSIESQYNEEELRYLRNCILDFVFYSEEGLPIKVIELQ